MGPRGRTRSSSDAVDAVCAETADVEKNDGGKHHVNTIIRCCCCCLDFFFFFNKTYRNRAFLSRRADRSPSGRALTAERAPVPRNYRYLSANHLAASPTALSEHRRRSESRTLLKDRTEEKNKRVRSASR